MPGKAVVDVLLAVNIMHLPSLFKSADEIRAQFESDIATVLRNSGLDSCAEFRIVHMHCYSQTLDSDSANEAGILARLREEHRADLVLDMTVLEDENVAGRAFTGGMISEFLSGSMKQPSEDCYLTEIDVQKSHHIELGQNWVAVHELSHLLGCGHSDTQNTEPWRGMYAFSAGAVDTEHSASTLMTYESRQEHSYTGGTFQELPILSHAGTWEYCGVQYNIGSAREDNRRTFQMMLPVVAGYRDGSPTAVYNDTPQHAFMLPERHTPAYYAARFRYGNEKDLKLADKIICWAEHMPHLLRGGAFCRVWGTTAHATAGTTEGHAANVWYRFTAEKETDCCAGFTANSLRTPGTTELRSMRCRLFRKDGDNLLPLNTTALADTEHVHHAQQFTVAAGDDIYVEIAAEQTPGSFQFFLQEQNSGAQLPEFATPAEAENYSGPYGLTALSQAALTECADDLKQLLKLGADPNSLNSGQGSALLLAAAAGHTEHCRLLLEHGAQPGAECDGHTPILAATLGGYTEIIELLRQAGAELDNRVPAGIGTMLMEHDCHCAIMRWVEAGMDVNFSTEEGNSALMHAAQVGHIPCVRLLLEMGANANHQNSQQTTPLMVAACAGHTECVRLLLLYGAQVDTADKAGITALSTAAARGRAECVRELLQAGATPNQLISDAISPLFLAILNGHTEVTELLLQYGADPLAVSPEGLSAVFAASGVKDSTILRRLIEAGANIKTSTKDGLTPLHYAAESGTAEHVRLLLEAGADISAKNTNGNTPLFFAAIRGKTDSVRLLLEHGADATTANRNRLTPLMGAALNGNTECMRLLLQHGATDTPSRVNRLTALMMAATKGSADGVRLLIEHGSDIQARDSARMSALSLAIKHGHTACAELLIEKGANTQIRNREGHTLLMLAAIYGQTECVRLLLKHGAATEETDKNNTTALIHAVIQGNLDCLELLADSGANIHATDSAQYTALFHAIGAGKPECVRALLQRGASLSSTLIAGNAPIHWAVLHEQPECLRALLEAGDELDRLNKEGESPMAAAAKIGSIASLRVLIDAGGSINAATAGAVPPILAAVQGGHESCFEALLQAGAELCVTDAQGNTLLHWAASWNDPGKINIISLLLERGLDANAKNAKGITPLMKAADYGSVWAFDELIEAGADATARCDKGKTLLHYAAKNGLLTHKLQMLQDKGVDIHAKDSGGHTALHAAAQSGYEQHIRHMAQAGLSVNEADTHGRTPLMLLMHSNPLHAQSAAKALLELGADLRAQDARGRTALHYAALHCDKEAVLSLLLEEGADPTATDHKGNTPADLARKAQNNTALKCLQPDSEEEESDSSPADFLKKFFD